MKKAFEILALVIIAASVILSFKTKYVCSVSDTACIASFDIIGKAIEKGDDLAYASRKAYKCAFFGDDSVVKVGGFHN